ncbi:MAG: choice-of-anchor Q domain-containing protein [Phycisphaerales bacterium]
MHSNRHVLTLATAAIAVASASSGAFAQSVTLTPANNIQAAINSGDFTEIILEAGVYNQTINFNGAAVTLRSTNPDDSAVVDATVISGENLGSNVVRMTSGEGPGSRLVGLTIAEGEAFGVGLDNRGGGLVINASDPTIDRCVFRDNEAGDFGGAMYINDSSPTIIDTEFRSNVASASGGAIYVNIIGELDLSGSVFVANTAVGGDGGGVRSQNGTLVLNDAVFTGNQAMGRGGGFYGANTRMEFNACTFEANAADSGGGIYANTSVTARSAIANSLFIRNEAPATGGGMFLRVPTDVTACTFVGNVSGNISAVDSEANSSPSFVTGCIIWGNDAPLTVFGNGNPTTTYTLVEGGLAGAGNIDVDPQFVDATGDDFRLMVGSPAIDAGDSFALLSGDPKDFDGNIRVIDDPASVDTGVVVFRNTIDMGAFEFQPDGGTGNPNCPADLDGSDSVDFADLLAVLSAFGTCP